VIASVFKRSKRDEEGINESETVQTPPT